jgi:hypothetical protein
MYSTDSIVQSSTADLSIYHQNVIGGNIKGTSYVDGFPTTSTGTSLGMYQHLGIDGQNNKRTDFLNVSGQSSGGYNFWTSNSTQSPQLLTNITEEGLSIPKQAYSYFTVAATNSGPNYVVMDFDARNPPSNWVLGEMYVARVGNSTLYMSAGIDYNCRYVDTQIITFHETADPNSPVINSTGILSVLLQIPANSDIALLSSKDLTFNTVSILPQSNYLNFTVDGMAYNFPCLQSSNQLTMCPQSNFIITATGSSIMLTTEVNLDQNFLSANIFRNNTLYPLQVDFITGNIMVLTGNFSGTQTIYFFGYILIIGGVPN